MNKLISSVCLSFVLLLATSESTFHKGVNAQQPFQRNRPDLNGLLIRNPVSGKIFWVDKGQRRYITHPATYARLFVTNHRDYLDTDAVEPGLPLNNDNRLVICTQQGHPLHNRIYFFDQGTKRYITSPDAIKRYNFNLKGLSNIDCPVLANIPDGSPIQ